MSDTWNIFVAKWQLYVSLMLIVVIAQSIIKYFVPTFGTDIPTLLTINNEVTFTPSTDMIALIIMVLIGIVTQAAVYYAVIHREEDIDIKEVLSQSIKLVIPFFMVSLISGMATFLGLMLFIVPGLVFYVWFSFAGFTVFKEHLTGIDALKRSKALVRGYWSPIFGRMIIFFVAMGIASSIINMIPVAGPLITGLSITPLSAIYMALIYEHRLKHFDK